MSFSLGIAARNAGMTPFQGLLASLLCNASAGEYAGFVLIAVGTTCFEIALITLIANARYLLMSCALSQRTSPTLKLRHRLLLAFGLTDEIFAIALARPGFINSYYSYGAFLIASPALGLGTALGTMAGSLMPVRLTNACSVALYGMFLAVIIPPARKNKIIAGLIAVCFAASYAAASLPMFRSISEGLRTIVLTVAMAALAALLFPHREKETS